MYPSVCVIGHHFCVCVLLCCFLYVCAQMGVVCCIHVVPVLVHTYVCTYVCPVSVLHSKTYTSVHCIVCTPSLSVASFCSSVFASIISSCRRTLLSVWATLRTQTPSESIPSSPTTGACWRREKSSHPSHLVWYVCRTNTVLYAYLCIYVVVCG